MQCTLVYVIQSNVNLVDVIETVLFRNVGVKQKYHSRIINVSKTTYHLNRHAIELSYFAKFILVTSLKLAFCNIDWPTHWNGEANDFKLCGIDHYAICRKCY